jgi:hypothetical protein
LLHKGKTSYNLKRKEYYIQMIGLYLQFTPVDKAAGEERGREREGRGE